MATCQLDGAREDGQGHGRCDGLVHGAKRVIVVMDHTAKDASPKLMSRCTLPLTGKHVVQRVITDLAVLDVAGGAFHLVELAPGVGLEQVIAATDTPVIERTA